VPVPAVCDLDSSNAGVNRNHVMCTIGPGITKFLATLLPVEHFIELVPLRKADASTIYETLTDCMKKKGLVIDNMIGMGFDGAATGRHNGVQALFKQESTSLNFCALPLPSLATDLCSSCKKYSRYQTCLHNTNYTLKILSLFTQTG